MKKRLAASLMLLLTAFAAAAQAVPPIVISTDHTSLVLTVGDQQHLYQSYLGERLAGSPTLPPSRHEAYVTAGMADVFEPALRLVHADGNPSLDLRYVRHTTAAPAQGGVHTTIELRDPQYPVQVTLHYVAYPAEDVIKTWMEIRHQENKPVVLSQFASAMLHLDAPHYWLSQYHGDWAGEMKQQDSELTSGLKIIDSKLGVRADMYQSPTFQLSLDQLATETSGEVLAGTLAWSGNFQLAFELDEKNDLRILAGMNPYASEYPLKPNETFATPAFIFTYSKQGKGLTSRNLHRWARLRGGVLDGTGPRYTLLNNWEATFFDFNEPKLDSIIDNAAKLGVDLFLLDDGWFGNKYPRKDDHAGLGDWQVTQAKLPHGIGHLIQTSEKDGVKFGIWIEPEAVNPQSELYEKHPGWVLGLPNRAPNLQRNQLLLDLTNPQVQDFVYNVVDELFTKNPQLAYIKWDSNRILTNAFSPYLRGRGEAQSKLYIDYIRGLYKVFARVRQKYPTVPIMLCSGGGGRVDYGALPYFTEYWPSDNTDGYERVFIQWGYSQFFPSLAMSAHVTSWNKQLSLKFRTDVAFMGRLGYDIRVNELTPTELKFSQQAVQTYKRLGDVIWHGDLYRLISPYEQPRAVVQYVNEARTQAVVMAYNLHVVHATDFERVRLQGLDPARQYRVRELNLLPGTTSDLPENDQVFSGDYLLKVGLLASGPTPQALTSRVLEVTVQ